MLLTRSPLINQASLVFSFDLHVLSTPPAFVLSQDQTLRTKNVKTISPENPPQKAVGNPNQKNTQKQKTGIKTKNKHTIEFTNNTPTIPTKPTKTSRKSQERRPPPQHQGRGDKRKIYTPTTPHVKPKPREPAHTSILLNEVLPALLFLYLCYTLISFSS